MRCRPVALLAATSTTRVTSTTQDSFTGTGKGIETERTVLLTGKVAQRFLTGRTGKGTDIGRTVWTGRLTGTYTGTRIWSRTLGTETGVRGPGGGGGGGGQGRGSRSTLYYLAAMGVLALGLSYAAVPLYRIFCQAYSYGGTTQAGHDAEKVGSMEAVRERMVRVRFNADTAASMAWNFKPQQTEIKVHPGETALAFYTARNPTDKPVVGVSTYNVVPFEAGQYFNKIQCFCFEEQILNPHEEVHMPVFFYIDPEFVEDPKMESVDVLTLSYTFFEAREGLQLPIPQFAR